MLENAFVDRLRETKRTFYCPNGHTFCYGETDSEKKIRELKDKLYQEEQRTRAAQNDATKYRDAVELTQNVIRGTERKLSATKGVATRRKNQLTRVASGLCPCCDQRFEDIAEHIRAAHPSYAPASESDDAHDEATSGAETEATSPATDSVEVR
jgi:hypothetical protein